jgi:hypothetical protein
LISAILKTGVGCSLHSVSNDGLHRYITLYRLAVEEDSENVPGMGGSFLLLTGITDKVQWPGVVQVQPRPMQFHARNTIVPIPLSP